MRMIMTILLFKCCKYKTRRKGTKKKTSNKWSRRRRRRRRLLYIRPNRIVANSAHTINTQQLASCTRIEKTLILGMWQLVKIIRWWPRWCWIRTFDKQSDDSIVVVVWMKTELNSNIFYIGIRSCDSKLFVLIGKILFAFLSSSTYFVDVDQTFVSIKHSNSNKLKHKYPIETKPNQTIIEP